MFCPYIGRFDRADEPYDIPSYHHVCHAVQTRTSAHLKPTLQWQEGYCLGGAFRGCPRYHKGRQLGVIPLRQPITSKRRFHFPFFARHEEDALSA